MIFIVLFLGLSIIALLWQVRRMSQRCRYQEAELQKARQQDSIGTLASGIAHDFNNILASVLGFGVLLEEDLTAYPDMQEMARQITTAARRGQSIVAQLMTYSRKNIAEDKEVLLPVSLNAVIRENMTLLEPCLRASTRLTYQNNAAQDIVLTNATQMGQVIVNLCINADHAIGVRSGLVKITLDNTRLDEPYGAQSLSVSGGRNAGDEIKLVNGRLGPGDYLRLCVTDNGDGMEKDVALRIFEPFFTTKEVGRGTGLGLAAIQGIVHSHGGGIAVTTQKFKGTTFEIMLPLPSRA